MPVAKRLREARVITDNQWQRQVVYDIERTFIYPVPEPLQKTIPIPLGATSAPVTLTETAALTAWCRESDLLTTEPPSRVRPTTHLPFLTDLSLDLAGSCNLDCVYCFEKEIPTRNGPMSSETAKASVNFLLARAGEATRVALHFGSGEPLLNFGLLQEVVAYSEDRAAAQGKQVEFHLTTNGTLVTEAKAEFIAAHPFFVRLSMDGPYHNRTRPRIGGKSSYEAAEQGFLALRDRLRERLTVNVVYCQGMRVQDIYLWATALGIANLEVIKVGVFQRDDVMLTDSHLLDFRKDLAWILADLRQRVLHGKPIVHYLPITKVLRRLIGPAPAQRYCGVAATYLGVSSSGELYPCFRYLGLKEYRLGNVVNGADDGKRLDYLSREAQPVDLRSICSLCWVRKLCGGGCYADSVTGGSDAAIPQIQHCAYWLAEIEAGILFYHELIESNPVLLFALIGRAAPQVE